MLCNQTTSYFDCSDARSDVIACSSARSEKGLPYLLVLAAKILALINSRGFLTSTGIHSVLNAIQSLVTMAPASSLLQSTRPDFCCMQNSH